MRITVDLPDELIHQVQHAALDANATLTEFIGDALRAALAQPPRKKPPKEFKLITYGKGELHPSVALDDTSALLDRMDGLDKPGRR